MDDIKNILPGDKYKVSIKDLDISFNSKGHFLIDCDYSDGKILHISIRRFENG